MIFRCMLFTGWILLIASFNAQAKVYSIPMLAEANHLLSSQPERSLEIASEYLSQRRIKSPQDQSRVHLNDDADHTIRTPLNTINAMQIRAQALSHLQRTEEALKEIKQAIQLSTDSGLTFTLYESQLMLAQFYWNNLKNSATALKMLDNIDKEIQQSPQLEMTDQLQWLKYRSLMLRALIESNLVEKPEKTEKLYLKAKGYLASLNDQEEIIKYQLAIGQHYFRFQQYDMALDRLLSGYWLAVEHDERSLIAEANYQLARLFEERNVLDKALEHATQAGEYYERYQHSQKLVDTLSLIASIYEQQQRYNLALVHYFNALDQEDEHLSSPLRLNIAHVYLHLHNYSKAKQYIIQAREIGLQNSNDEVVAGSQILQGKLDLAQNKLDESVTSLQAGLIAASRIGSLKLQLSGESALSQAFEKQNDYYNALLSQRRYEQLFSIQQKNTTKNNIEVFKQQQKIMERSLLLEEMEREKYQTNQALYKQHKISLILASLFIIVLLVLISRLYIVKRLKKQLEQLRSDYFTHPRSGLKNVRMLNAKLADSLQESSDHFEQRSLAEIINEPLSDRLCFALFEVSFLKSIYLKKGYQQGLKAEKEFGRYLKQQVLEPARIYHFSDAMFLYIEPNARLSCDPKQLANSIELLVENYTSERGIKNNIQMGMAEYPFLPRAYTAINDKELIDILLMAVNASSKIKDDEQGSHWVHLSAIDTAPAASFACDEIRDCCVKGIDKGLIKVVSSSKDEIIWDNNHDSN